MPSGDGISPVCFDGREDDVARSIVGIHDLVVRIRGFNPSLSGSQVDELSGRVMAVVVCSFCTMFGVAPTERFGDIFDQIAFFAEHLAKDHVFHDGNKRTTLLVSLAFLARSGCIVDMPDMDSPEDNEMYRWIQDTVTGERTQNDLAEDLRWNSVMRSAE